jgi:hypothetical protein
MLGGGEDEMRSRLTATGLLALLLVAATMGGATAIIAQVRAAERSDPEGQSWPRGKRHDDASAAFCHLI